MKLDDLTIGEAKQLAAMFGGAQTQGLVSPSLGKYVIVRTYSAGVHCGVLQAKQGDQVILSDTRRIWKWAGAKTLSEIAVNGLDVSGSKVSQAVDTNELTAIEVIPCSEKATKVLRGAKWAE